MALAAGDLAYVCVTDHPKFPREFHAGDSYLWEDENTAKRIAAAWNEMRDDDNPWTWYAKAVVLLPPRARVDEDERQDALF